MIALRKRAAAAVATLALMGGAGIMAASAASASTVGTYAPAAGYQFASNTGQPGLSNSNDTYWRVLDTPMGYSQASQALGGTGVAVSATADSAGYADSGVIVPLGTITSSGLLNSDGTLSVPAWKGTGPLSVNIYFDKSGDGTYFSFNSDGIYQGENGDAYAITGGQPVPPATVTADEGAQGAATKIWAWVGVDSTTNGSAVSGAVSSVAGKTLVSGIPQCADSLAGNCGDYQNVYGNGLNVKGAPSAPKFGSVVIAYPNENNPGDDFVRQTVLANGDVRVAYAPHGHLSGSCLADPDNPALGSAAHAVVVNPCNTGNFQEWKEAAGGHLVNAADGRVLTPNGTRAQLTTVPAATVAGAKWTWTRSAG